MLIINFLPALVKEGNQEGHEQLKTFFIYFSKKNTL